jgi:hypothetical protein
LVQFDSFHDYIIGILSAMGAAIVALVRIILGNKQAIAVIQSKHDDTTKQLDELRTVVKEGFRDIQTQLTIMSRSNSDRNRN